MKYLWINIYLFLFPLVLKSNGIDIDIVPIKNSFKPGTSTSFPITLVNKESTDIEYEISVLSRNSKIKVLTLNKTISIQPHKKEIILIPINIALDCAKGTHIIELKVLNIKETSYQLFEIKINVAENEYLTITPIDNIEYIKAGDTIISEFLVKNHGNIKQFLSFSTNNGVLKEQKNILFNAQEEKIIKVYKPTNPKENHPYSEIIDLHINRHSKEVISAYTHINVIPTNTQRFDPYKRLPIKLAVRYLNMKLEGNRIDGLQGELFMHTKLSEKLNDTLEVKLLTKNPESQNYYAQYDEYYARYSNQNSYIHVGDKVFSASFLTEYSRYGRGLEIQHKINKITVNSFYNKPRFFDQIKEEINLKTNYIINNKNRVSLGYLNKKENISMANENFSTIHLPYITIQSNQIKGTIVDLEYANSKHNNNIGSAYKIGVITKINKLSAGVNYVYSSPKFRGYFNNTKILNGNINYIISKKINLFAYHLQNTRNEQLDTLFLAAPLFKQSQLGLDFKYAKNGQISVFNGYMMNEDRLPFNLFKYEEYFSRLNLNQQLSFIHIGISNQFGFTKNYITSTNGKSSVHQVNLTAVKYNTNLTLFGTLANTNRYESTQTKSIYYGGKIIKNIDDKISINLAYQSNYMPEEYYRERNQFEGSISYIHKNHQLDLDGRYFIQRGRIGNKDFIVALTYRTTLKIPIKRIHKYTTLSGNIKNDKENLKGIKVKLGNEVALSDKNGNYTFKNIIPGNYYLDMDRSTLPIDEINRISLPKLISIKDTSVNVQNFSITKSASIKGKISFTGALDPSVTNVEFQEILASKVIIEANNGYKKISKTVHINEKFDFTFLQPGIWKVKIHTQTLNKNVKIEQDNFEFNLSSNEIKTINIEVKPIQREIFHQQGTIKVGYIGQK